ncbi:MAG: alpha/beta fold hydrolase [bacterium]
MTGLSLHFREFGRGDKTLVILHGLLGSSQNWQRAAKILGEKYRVLVVDQRNHGESPHTPTHTLDDLREDMRDFFEQQNLASAYLLGHSMGGMAAMEFAFHYPDRLQGLIIEDIAPRGYRSSSVEILAALSELDLSALTSRQQAEAQLEPRIPGAMERQFVLTNLARKEDGSYYWRANLPALQAYNNESPKYEPPVHARYDGESLFIGGASSEYRLAHDHHLLLQHFPNSHLEMIPNAGHWIHFEAVEAFTTLVRRFIDSGSQAFQ